MEYWVTWWDDLSRGSGKDAAWGCQETWAELPPSGHQRLQQGQASLGLKLGLERVC